MAPSMMIMIRHGGGGDGGNTTVAMTRQQRLAPATASNDNDEMVAIAAVSLAVGSRGWIPLWTNVSHGNWASGSFSHFMYITVIIPVLIPIITTDCFMAPYGPPCTFYYCGLIS